MIVEVRGAGRESWARREWRDGEESNFEGLRVAPPPPESVDLTKEVIEE
tara:strand:- start:555 stop:701 length:147 start_codon:yes stop_codon:yes gene_type:complete